MDAKPDSGLRGKRQAEKRRIGRLSRSERVIEDPEDREDVAAFSRYMIWYYDQKAKRQPVPLRWLPSILLISCSVVSFEIKAPVLGSVLGVLATVGVTARVLNGRWERQLLRTAAINGWIEGS
jgi:hypothetical protein